MFSKSELKNYLHESAREQAYPWRRGHWHYRRRKVLILVADVRIREGQLSSVVTLLENPRHCAASQLRLHQFFALCDITTVTNL